MRKRWIAVLAVVPLASIHASAQPAVLLEQLSTSRQEIVNKTISPTSLQRPDLAPLIGVSRRTLAEFLGVPDFCLPDPHKCINAVHWAYFFYPYQPPSIQTDPARKIETLTMTLPGAGWGLEVNFSKEGSIQRATWVKEE